MVFLLSLLKFHSGPQALQHPFMPIQLHPGDTPGATGRFQGNGNIHLAITVTARVHTILRKTFFPSAFIFHLIHFPLLFHLENCCTNLWWNGMGREGFLLSFCSCHLYIPLCTCQAWCLKWPAEGGLWEQPRHPVWGPKLQHFLNPKHYPGTPWWVSHRFLTSELTLFIIAHSSALPFTQPKCMDQALYS